MPIFIIQAVQRSGDGLNSVRVISRWPYEAAGLQQAREFANATPAFAGWEKIDAFEVVTPEGKLLAQRPFQTSSDDDWVEA